ncbi:hypothetical protein MC885_014349 [Smutsia gigantea]|nr:hypothetical protein MC885_014349 [Smutsia gigantea]
MPVSVAAADARLLPGAGSSGRCWRRPWPAGRMSDAGARPSLRAQPAVKSVLVYRNGDPFFAGRRVVLREKGCSFDALLREVTRGVRAPFGAVRNLYTPRAGHRVRRLEQVQSGASYVAGGREAFKKLSYLDIGEMKKRPMEVNTEVMQIIL